MGFHYRWFDRDQEKTDEMGIPLTRASFLVFELRKIIRRCAGTYGTSIANAMQGFSIALILGAIAMVLTT